MIEPRDPKSQGSEPVRQFKTFLIPIAVLSWIGIIPPGGIAASQVSAFWETTQAWGEGRKDTIEKESLPESRGELLAAGYIDIHEAQSPLNLKEGDRFFYTYPKWSSVGIGAKYFIEDKAVVKFVGNIVHYDHPIRMMTGMTGADEGSGTFIFKAVRKGRTKLTIRKDFRGEDKEELKSVEILVE